MFKQPELCVFLPLFDLHNAFGNKREIELPNSKQGGFAQCLRIGASLPCTTPFSLTQPCHVLVSHLLCIYSLNQAHVLTPRNLGGTALGNAVCLQCSQLRPTCLRIRASLPCVTRQPDLNLESSGLGLGFGASLPRAVGQWVMASVLRVYRHALAAVEALKPLNRHPNRLSLVR